MVYKLGWFLAFSTTSLEVSFLESANSFTALPSAFLLPKQCSCCLLTYSCFRGFTVKTQNKSIVTLVRFQRKKAEIDTGVQSSIITGNHFFFYCCCFLLLFLLLLTYPLCPSIRDCLLRDSSSDTGLCPEHRWQLPPFSCPWNSLLLILTSFYWNYWWWLLHFLPWVCEKDF